MFSRDQGLEKSIQNLKLQTDEKIHDNKKLLNDHILEELMEIKDVLDAKSQEIDIREDDLATREKELKAKENNLGNLIKENIENYAAEVREKIKSEVNIQFKRIKMLEKTVGENLKLVKTKLVLSKSTASLNKSQDSSAVKLKARIQSLEKSNEHLKAKLGVLEAESKNDKTVIAKFQEELVRVRARSSMLEQSLSQSQRPKVEIDIPSSPVQTVNEPETNTNLISVSPELSLSISTIYTLINCSKLTLSVVNAPSSPRSVRSSISHRTSIIVNDSPSSIGEIYYPAFNSLIPQIFELLPFIHKLKNTQIQYTLLWGA